MDGGQGASPGESKLAWLQEAINAMQADCDVAIAGLEGRVQWERVSIPELTLFIPYELEISDCSPHSEDD
jgi:hypothetical protein